MENNNKYKNRYSSLLIESKNIIFRGAPGTGKTYLAKQIAADIVTDGECCNYDDLNDEQKKQIGFVQFHPSYDYSDFVEGLRPKRNGDGSIGFELQNGIFKKFIDQAKNGCFYNKTRIKEYLEQNEPLQDIKKPYPRSFHFEKITDNGMQFYVENKDLDCYETERFYWDQLTEICKSGRAIRYTDDIMELFDNSYDREHYSFLFCVYKELFEHDLLQKKERNYVFIIDEINRGEMSKIFGELFFAIDPEYRGTKGQVFTQYSNLHSNPDEKFYIPENVYIIGTMNDIDRSVDSFDFAMRRRFRFIEITPECNQNMLECLNYTKKEIALKKMNDLNKEIVQIPELNKNYQIGPAYFLKLGSLNFDDLWTDHLLPLIQDYVQGMYKDKEILEKLAKAYGYPDKSNDTFN